MTQLRLVSKEVTLAAILALAGCTDSGSNGQHVGGEDSSSSGGDPTPTTSEPTEGEGSSEGETTTSTDPDSSTSDTDAPAGTLLELLATVPEGTSWADLDPDTRAAIEQHAADRFADSDAQWGARALMGKEATLLGASTEALDASFDAWARVRLAAPEDFSATTDVPAGALADALRRAYLAEVATQRCELVYFYPEPPTEWDGAAPLTGCPTTTSEATRADLRAYAASVHASLVAIDPTGLDATAASLRQRALWITRALAAGSLSFWGVDELQTPWGAVAFSADPYFSWSYAPELFADGEAYIQSINAATQQPLHWIDVGTVGAALEYTFPAWVLEDEAAEVLGDPTLARYHVMLWGWWRERLLAEAPASCTAYDAETQDRFLDGLTGNLYFDAEETATLADLAPMTELLSDIIVLDYQDVAYRALQAVFPDDAILTSQQRAFVITEIFTTEDFGRLPQIVMDGLDTATGDTVASSLFAAALADVPVLALDREGNVPPEVEAQVQAMWTEVRAFLIARFDGYVVDYAAALPETIAVTADFGAFASPAGVTLGLGSPRNVAEAYATMLHEAHHVVNYNAGLLVEGTAIEGAAERASRQVRVDLLASALDPVDAAMGELFLVSSDARLVGFTNATLAVLTRTSCDGVDTRENATAIAASYGVSEDDLQLASHRAHNGTQYLSYMIGEVLYRDLLGYFSAHVSGGQLVLAWDLQKCGMPAAAPTEAVAAELDACMHP